MDPDVILNGYDVLVTRIERALGCKIVVDTKVFHEVLLRAGRSLEKTKLDGIPRPHDHKKAGHYAFWLRKLKPFRVFMLSELEDQLRQVGVTCPVLFQCVNASVAKDTGTVHPQNSHKYVNEWIALWTGIAFVLGTHAAREIIMTQPFLRDFLAGLRYDAYTPDNLAILFESIAQQDRSNDGGVRA